MVFQSSAVFQHSYPFASPPLFFFFLLPYSTAFPPFLPPPSPATAPLFFPDTDSELMSFFFGGQPPSAELGQDS
jgi:hypothetical protein